MWSVLDRVHLYHYLPGLARSGRDALTYATQHTMLLANMRSKHWGFIRSFVDAEETSVLGELGCAYTGRSH